jgi:hypothetical protein
MKLMAAKEDASVSALRWHDFISTEKSAQSHQVRAIDRGKLCA